jgi:CHAD domain-containing protein
MLSEQDEEAGELKMPRNLKKIYRVTGSIRDLQMHLLQIRSLARKETKQPTAYIKIMQKELDRLQKKMSQYILHKKPFRIKKKILNAIQAGFSLSSFMKYIPGKRTAIYTIIESGDFADKNIHRIRKILKDIFYNLELYRVQEEQFLLPEKRLMLKSGFFDELLEMLGNYQDKCTSIGLLSSSRCDHLNQSNLEILKQVKEKWQNEKISQKRILVNRIKNDLTQQLAVL